MGWQSVDALIHHEMLRATSMTVAVKWREVGGFEKSSDSELINFINQLSVTGEI